MSDPEEKSGYLPHVDAQSILPPHENSKCHLHPLRLQHYSTRPSFTLINGIRTQPQRVEHSHHKHNCALRKTRSISDSIDAGC